LSWPQVNDAARHIDRTESAHLPKAQVPGRA
jgi:hypothetical protein